MFTVEGVRRSSTASLLLSSDFSNYLGDIPMRNTKAFRDNSHISIDILCGERKKENSPKLPK